MAKKKKKPNIHKVNPIIIREINEEEEVIHNNYAPVIEENTSKSEPDTEPLEFEPVEDAIISDSDLDSFIEEVKEEIIEEAVPEEILEDIIPIEEPIEFETLDVPVAEVSETIKIEIVESPEKSVTIEIPTKETLKEEIIKIEENIEKLKEVKEVKPKKESKRKETKPKPKKEKKAETPETIQDHDININNIPDLLVLSEDVKEEVIELIMEEIKDNVVINPNVDVSISHRFIELSQNPFELRYKTIKIYDSKISKESIAFKHDHVLIDGKKYPYSNLRIINK